MTHAAFDRLDADDINVILQPGWTDYSAAFVLAASGSAPTKGATTYFARYRRVPDADSVFVQIKVTIGAGFAPGSGNFWFPLPASLPVSGGAASGFLGPVYILDAGTRHYTAIARPVSTTHLEVYRDDNASGIGSGVPVVWATGDIIDICFEYQP